LGFLKHVPAIVKSRFTAQDEESRIPLITAERSSKTLTNDTLEYFSRVDRRLIIE